MLDPYKHEDALGTNQAACLLGTTPAALRRLARLDRVPARKYDGHWLFSAFLLRSWSKYTSEPGVSRAIRRYERLRGHKPVPQRRYRTLQDFKARQNNFFFHFLDGGVGPLYRAQQHHWRFQNAHPAFHDALTLETTNACNNYQPRPWKKLYKAYNLMCRYVTIRDLHVISEGRPSNLHLWR